MCNICKELERLSFDTWDRIGFARSRAGFRIFETTITQNILFELKKFSESSGNNSIELFEARDEKRNGNDIDLFVQYGDGDRYIFFPLQAKILYSNTKYSKMEHGNQILDLIDYATKADGIPMYLLYNHTSDISLKKYGCSVVSAIHLRDHYADKRTYKGTKKWKIPTFDDLHPSYAEPWQEFFCIFLNIVSSKSIPPDNGLFSRLEAIETIQTYQKDTLLDDTEWMTMKGNSKNSQTIKDEHIQGFAPAYRIILSKEKT
ncbi:MAG: hypothetical protein LGB78_02140 [Sulfurovum sp.]|nr:hypothetical protein [Sulfurovum sp.]MCB4782702.1 hypothetical protein [Sulfurovum sp.]